MPSFVTTLLHNWERAGQGMLSSTPTPGTLAASPGPGKQLAPLLCRRPEKAPP